MYKKIFIKSWKELRANLTIALPDISAMLFALLLGAIFLYTAGAFEFATVLENIPTEEEARAFIIETVLNNLGIILSYASTWLILSFIVTIGARAIKLGMIRDIILKRKPSLKKARTYLQKHFLRLAGLSVVTTIIFSIVFLACLSVLAMVAKTNAAGWIIFLVLLVLALISLWTYLLLFYSKAVLVMENKGILASVASAAKTFRKRKVVVVKILLIVIVTATILNIIGSIINMIPVVGEIITSLIYIAIGLWSGLFIFNTYHIRKKFVR